MSYQVIARKWRPKSFGELVGQSHVTQTLLNALRSGRLPHALLFSGARGVGKTSSARIFAKSLRCPNAKDFVPCNQCQTCEEIAQGHHIDVIEIDGASNNGVDAIRELRETVGYMPASGKYKVYIIDEVHMLSTSAFNALLKTLEEPPAHVVFIFATTEAQKIPVTILSRCQRFDFRRIPTRQIAERLELICQSEGIPAEPEALWTIARQAEGALRDSQSLLDQAITFCDGKITLEKVTQVLGLTDRVLLLETIESLISRDAQKSLTVIEKLYDGGFDASVYVQDLLEQLRHLLMVKLNPKEARTIVDLPESEIEALAQLAGALSAEDIHMLFDMTLKGANDLIRSQNSRIVLEMLLLRMTSAPRITEIQSLLGATAATTSTSSGTSGSSGGGESQKPPFIKPSDVLKAQKQQKNTTIPNFAPTGTPTTLPQTSTPPAATAATPAPVVEKPIYNPTKNPQENWLALVEKIKSQTPSIGAKLEFLSLIELTPTTISLGSKDQLIQKQLSEKITLAKLEGFFQTYWQKTLTVRIDIVTNDAGPMSPLELTRKKEQESQNALLEEIERFPLVQKTQNTFKTKITSIKEQK